MYTVHGIPGIVGPIRFPDMITKAYNVTYNMTTGLPRPLSDMIFGAYNVSLK